MVTKAGRQVSKSTNLAAKGLIISNMIPDFSTLYITPLFEMIRRFSHNYVGRFVDESPIKKLIVGENTSKNVLQRSFRNRSMMTFSFAFLDADRTRGIWADKVSFDEIQDLDPDHIPIIMETMSASLWKIAEFSGTPKTLDNTCEIWWQDSSQGEWVIKCHHGGCGKDNWPSLEQDLEKMIGPVHDDISEDCPGLVCAYCQKHLRPREMGRWLHLWNDRKWDVRGTHVPQMILPMHYADPEAWAQIVGKRQRLAYNVFLNEVCGESYDVGAKLVTITDLKRAAQLHPNVLDQASGVAMNYPKRIIAVDWGGGGEDGVSYTSIAVMGMSPDGGIDVIYGRRSLTPYDHEGEARLVLDLVNRFHATHIAHDYTGAGALRETFIVQAGFPLSKIVPIHYTRAGREAIMLYKPSTPNHPRPYYTIDKARSLVLVCNQIKTQRIRFFGYDYKNPDEPGLLHDFLALMEEKIDRKIGGDVYTITRSPKKTDDFAQAVNIGACTLWHHTKSWPDIADTAKFAIDREDFFRLHLDQAAEQEFDGPYNGFL
jgi:hypothetical protein